jgi:hypothetical protein
MNADVAVGDPLGSSAIIVMVRMRAIRRVTMDFMAKRFGLGKV